MDSNHQSAKRAHYIAPIFFTILAISKYVFRKYPGLKKLTFSFFIAFWGMLITNGNLDRTQYSMYEMWMVYM